MNCSIHIEDGINSKRIEYVLSFISQGCGIGFQFEEGGIYYGNKPLNRDAYQIIIPFDSSIEVKSNHLLEIQDLFNVDFFTLIFKLLSDEINPIEFKSWFDVHGRLKFDHSFQNMLSIEKYAVIDRLVNEFCTQILSKNLGKYWLPKGKTFAIGLSHDVDNPMKYAILSAPLIYEGASPSDLKYIVKKKLKGVARFFHDPNPNNYWIFDKVMEAESKHGFKSTSYFAATPYYAKNGAKRDVPYNIEHPKFQDVFKMMRDAGFEIGLHAGYNAYKSTDRFKAEKLKLESIAQVEVQGLRHHYWHLGPDPEATLQMHAEAGFIYDSSIGFNDHMGFRRSVASPYFPWSHRDERAIGTLQLPVFCMDGNLFNRTNDVDVALKEFELYLDEIERVGGVGMIDWHTRTSFPSNKQYRNWGEGYVRILELLSSRSNAWVTSGIEIANRFLQAQNSD